MKKRVPNRFRITSFGDRRGIGPLDMVFIYRGEYELEFQEPFKSKRGEFVLQVPFEDLLILGEGPVEFAGAIKNSNNRLIRYVQEHLKAALVGSETAKKLLIELNSSEVDDLLQVDPEKVTEGDWINLSKSSPAQGKIFISCGQRTKEERDLGTRVENLIKEGSSFETYFAESQQSMEGVTSNIFRALEECIAFIAIMHRRESLEGEDGDHRGSLWIEQEISIGAFLRQTHGKNLPIKAFTQEGIRLEGVREHIMLNPVPFEDPDDVIQELEKWLEALPDLLV